MTNLSDTKRVVQFLGCKHRLIIRLVTAPRYGSTADHARDEQTAQLALVVPAVDYYPAVVIARLKKLNLPRPWLDDKSWYVAAADDLIVVHEVSSSAVTIIIIGAHLCDELLCGPDDGEQFHITEQERL